MTDLTITHSHAEGTLIEGTSKGDGAAAVLKANRWRWGRSIAAWFIPCSRDRHAKTWQIEATAGQLREAGFGVEVVVDDTARPAAEVEADRAARAEDRAQALEAKARRKDAAAAAADERHAAAGAALPEGGEPIKVGHHSEARHRRAIETAHRRMGEVVAADRDAAEAHRRAEVAAKAADRRHSPDQVANRIAKLQAEIRRIRRGLEGYTAHPGSPYAEQVPPVTGPARQRLTADLAAQQDHLSYWQGVREQQVSSGQVAVFSRDQISPEDQILAGGLWHIVARANPKTVTVYADRARGVISSYKVAYDKIRDHRPAQG
jgi:hypothetical protein